MPRIRPQRRVGLLHMLTEQDRLVQGVLDYAAHADHWQFAGHPHYPYVLVEQVDPSEIDGVIGLFHEERWLGPIVASGVTAVNTSNRLADQPLPCVGHDERAIGRLGAEHLLACGFGHFGFIGWDLAWFAAERMEAFREAIEDAGRVCYTMTVEQYMDRGNVARVGRWLASLPKPLGVMAFADPHGAVAIEAATELGLGVPADVAVLGVGTDWRLTAMTRPPMSSIELDARQVGYRAAQMLDELMDEQHPPSPQRVKPIGVVPRRSTRITRHKDPCVTEAMNYIREYCAAGLTVADVVEAVDVSRTTLETRLKRATGQTPQAAIYHARIERAKNLLLLSQDNLGQIARACGFARQDHFCTVFKRIAGVTPGQFRQQRSR
jgi:LacI family transcriptional regulator